MKKVIGAFVVMIVMMSGCAKIVGPYYLEQGKYEEGVETLTHEYRENPNDASTAYYLGRLYLALNKPEQAMPYLERAVAADPADADYLFWQGVGYWALMDFDREREMYIKVLRIEPKHISANLYLGHNYLDRGEVKNALGYYDKVIVLDEFNPEALYNRGTALHDLGMEKEAVEAWKKFLEYYPDGSLALQATERLNIQGDFTYRNFIIGKRNVTLRTMVFKPGTFDLTSESKESLHVLAAMMEENKILDLHVVGYSGNGKNRARRMVQSVRDYMLSGHPDFDRNRLLLSWFGTPEVVGEGKRSFTLDDSVKFITVVR